jgi:hypothetical protein
MAVSGKYGKIDIPKIGKDEPVFILRAQDKLAELTIEIYRLLVSAHNQAMSKDLEREVDVFRQWKGPKKVPD